MPTDPKNRDLGPAESLELPQQRRNSWWGPAQSQALPLDCRERIFLGAFPEEPRKKLLGLQQKSPEGLEGPSPSSGPFWLLTPSSSLGITSKEGFPSQIQQDEPEPSSSWMRGRISLHCFFRPQCLHCVPAPGGWNFTALTPPW